MTKIMSNVASMTHEARFNHFL